MLQDAFLLGSLIAQVNQVKAEPAGGGPPSATHKCNPAAWITFTRLAESPAEENNRTAIIEITLPTQPRIGTALDSKWLNGYFEPSWSK